jgi:hypothetical protein
VQHGEQHGEAVGLEADRQAARVRRVRRIDQRLDLDEKRARAFQRRQHAGAGDGFRVLRKKECRRIGYAAQALFRHGEDAELVHRAEAILRRAH